MTGIGFTQISNVSFFFPVQNSQILLFNSYVLNAPLQKKKKKQT
jgi:hypothetical protein